MRRDLTQVWHGLKLVSALAELPNLKKNMYIHLALLIIIYESVSDVS